METFDFNALINYGALGICLAYFIYKDTKSSRELRETMTGVKEVVTFIKEWLTKKGE